MSVGYYVDLVSAQGNYKIPVLGCHFYRLRTS